MEYFIGALIGTFGWGIALVVWNWRSIVWWVMAKLGMIHVQ